MKVGLSLSGGGVRCAAHIGVLKVLEKYQVPIDMISGTSAAAIISSLYSVGYTPGEIEDIFLEYCDKRIKKYEIMDLNISGCIGFIYKLLKRCDTNLSGFFKGEGIEGLMRRLCNEKGAVKMSDARIPLAIPAVDLHTADITMFVSDKKGLEDEYELVYYSNIDICSAVRASTSIPLVFAPKELDGRLLVDGGVRQNLPSEVLREMGASVIIGVDVGYYGQEKHCICSMSQIASRTMDIISYQMITRWTEIVDHMLFPQVNEVGILDFKRMRECIECGEKTAQQNIHKILKLF